MQYRNRRAAEIGIQRDLSKVASIKLFGMDMFNAAADCIIDKLNEKGQRYLQLKRTCNWEQNIFSQNWSPKTLERASFSSQIVAKDSLYMEASRTINPSISIFRWSP